VGKSSLLNHFTQSSKLAHISSKPGKTQLINFFSFGETYTLVDLPGYGFAKVPKTMREKWGGLIQGYLEDRKNLSLILLLIDLRHPPTKDDLAFAKWASHFNKPFLVVFTKSDKLKPNEQKKMVQTNLPILEEALGEIPPYVLYSIKDGACRVILGKKIEEYVK
jgi:GTP-binding protein